ncbi:DUF3021 domain-containing protein [Ligilactobacillus ceti]|nr:DUF3021 domain-containing protein [Ligilactobacillus ceti]
MKEQNLYDRIRKILVGALMGVGIGYIIALCFSVKWGAFSPAPLVLVEKVGNIKAAEMLALYSGLVGAVFAGTKFIWDIEKWSLVKSSFVYFTINLLVMSCAGYRLYWFSHNIKNYFSFLSVYIVIFIAIWVVTYFKNKKNVKELNDKLNQIKK